ncbi:MAG: hypothetical protein VB128_01720 [Sedimentibacter saalensis]|nr:hypothetical protein [Sedimentibacter saalensis]MEA5093649.1 hypothetical protein [Sedimentibacter saalensis]
MAKKDINTDFHITFYDDGCGKKFADKSKTICAVTQKFNKTVKS